jgi:major type 1 subunit fimbrin (pilin)
MIKRITPLAIMAATLLAPPLWAADGTMKFSGKLTENTCTLDAGSKNQTVDMGRISVNRNYLATTGTGWLTIKLNDCPASSNKALIQFEGTSAASDYVPGKVFAFSNAGQPGAAGNVGFVIGNSGDTSDKLISVNGESKLFSLSTGASSVNELQFFLGYYKLNSAQPITTGSAIGNMQFSIIYP